MAYLSAYVTLSNHPAALFGNSGLADCSYNFEECYRVSTGTAVFDCYLCNGLWEIKSEHSLSAPPGYYFFAPAPSPSSPTYVAFGDSLTTGFSIPDCGMNDADRYKNGCEGDPNGLNRMGQKRDPKPTVTPYPERVASALGLSDGLDRVGVFGYTATRANEDVRENNRYSRPWPASSRPSKPPQHW